MGDSLFASGSDVLSANAKKSVDGAIRGVNKGASLRVEGFSDSKPITKSKWASNEALSQARADAVRKYLSSKGYGSVDAIGYGAVSRNGKSPSRRVEIVVVE
jgi:flagellar motor protein MotB